MATEDYQLGTLYPLYVDLTTPITTPGLDVEIPGDFQLIACLTDNGFDGSTDQIDTSSKCGGIWKDSIPGQRGWTMSGNGNAINVQVGSDQVSHNILFEKWKSGETNWWGIFDPELNSVRYGLAFISSFSEANPNAEKKTFNITIQGKGEPYGESATT